MCFIDRARYVLRATPLFLAALVVGCSGGGSVSNAPPLPRAGPYVTSVVVKWNEVALQAIRDTHPGPPMVARQLAIVDTAMYDAWAAYDPIAVGTRLGGTLRRPPAERQDVEKNKAVSFAAYRALVDLFPTQAMAFGSLMTTLGYDPSDASTDVTIPSGIGNVAAQALVKFRRHDGANQLGDLGGSGPYADYTGYHAVNTPTQINDPNHWQPLCVPQIVSGPCVEQKFVGAQWGNVAPFALTSVMQFAPASGPEVAGSPGYLAQAQQILDYSANLTDTQKVVAEYWANGPRTELPPGHWTLFGNFVSQRDKHDIDADAKMFFAMSNAIFDASVACWGGKRVYDSVRPITAIHYLFKGQMVRAWAGPGKGTQLIDGSAWNPFQASTFVTPPFPEYVSGHSAFSAAGAEILRDFTGSDAFGASYTALAGSSAVEPGTTPATNITLSWPTFSAAADEAGISRRYGGIHFEQGDLRARALGRAVAANAWAKAQTYWNGTGVPIGPP